MNVRIPYIIPVKNQIDSIWPRKLYLRIRQLLEQYHYLINPLFVFLISRIVILGVAYLSYVVIPTEPGHWLADPNHQVLSLLARWDSQWYNWIIEEGYWLRPGQQSNVAFFPLYPLAVNLLRPYFGNSTVLTSTLVSNIAFYLALVVLYKLTLLEFNDQKTAQRSIYYLAIFPTSFFFSAMYTESLYLLVSVSAIYFARQKYWAWAALMGILASATRIIGILTWGLVMWEWLRVHGWTLNAVHQRSAWVNLWKGFRNNWGQVILISTIPLGLLSYMLFLQFNFRDPISFSTTQVGWFRENIGVWNVIASDIHFLVTEQLNQGNLNRLLNLATLIMALVISIFAWRKIGAGYGLFSALSLLAPATSANQSMLRYALVCFPIFMVLGYWGRHSRVNQSIISVFSILLGLLTAFFVNWIFVA